MYYPQTTLGSWLFKKMPPVIFRYIETWSFEESRLYNTIVLIRDE